MLGGPHPAYTAPALCLELLCFILTPEVLPSETARVCFQSQTPHEVGNVVAGLPPVRVN